MTQELKKFILDNFFLDSRFAGSVGIGEKLLDSGSSIVANSSEERNIFHDREVGEFIKVTDTTEAINCLKYEFDSVGFFASEAYRRRLNERIAKLKQERNTYTQELRGLGHIDTNQGSVVALYTAVFAIGGFSHLVTLYPGYTKEKGLTGEGQGYRSRSAAKIMTELKDMLTNSQKKTLRSVMLEKADGTIVDGTGSTINNKAGASFDASHDKSFQ